MTDRPMRDTAMTQKAPAKPFTGRHMAIILVTFFGVVVVVNVTNAYFAASTFGGLVVDNSYVASQKFNGWLKEARAEKALGWRFAATRLADGRLDVAVSSEAAPLVGAQVEGVARHPLGRMPERTLRFVPAADGHYASAEALPTGRWIIHVQVKAQGRALKRIVDLQ